MVRIRIPRGSRGRTSFTTSHNLDTPVSPSIPQETPRFRDRRRQEGDGIARELYISYVQFWMILVGLVVGSVFWLESIKWR
ncbi:hypothetical protein B0H65DRAFT_464973 [Neurospora tetraspora]|uniref:Uncharacterized protein n=1 Tax=Neurospora tetraspora TaxID=94610 RepID=A0AAE0JEN2_9PEZI|nr:hypothetical protein B0H65DRAFT_464973 [Neurospora tetraspora]